jgi:hypothetical protein
MKKLLTVTAVLELATGVSLLIAPSLTALLLLGAAPGSPAAVLLGRVAGAALLSIGLACWLDRNRSPIGRMGLVNGLAAYNALAAVLLAYGALADGMNGVALWPACGAHVALLIWCVRSLAAGARVSRTQMERSR